MEIPKYVFYDIGLTYSEKLTFTNFINACFRALGIKDRSKADTLLLHEINNKWKQEALRLHPDKNPTPEATTKFEAKTAIKELLIAYIEGSFDTQYRWTGKQNKGEHVPKQDGPSKAGFRGFFQRASGYMHDDDDEDVAGDDDDDNNARMNKQRKKEPPISNITANVPISVLHRNNTRVRIEFKRKTDDPSAGIIDMYQSYTLTLTLPPLPVCLPPYYVLLRNRGNGVTGDAPREESLAIDIGRRRTYKDQVCYIIQAPTDEDFQCGDVYIHIAPKFVAGYSIGHTSKQLVYTHTILSSDALLGFRLNIPDVLEPEDVRQRFTVEDRLPLFGDLYRNVPGRGLPLGKNGIRGDLQVHVIVNKDNMSASDKEIFDIFSSL